MVKAAPTVNSASELRAKWSGLLAPDERTIPAMLSRQAERCGRKPLVSTGGATWSYVDTGDAAARFAGILKNAGIERGDRIAVICSNRIEFLEITLGCAWLGAVAVPINVASRGPQLQHILSNSGARLLVLERAYLDNLTMLTFAELALDTIWLVDGEGDECVAHLTAVPMPRDGTPVPAAPVTPDDLAFILYTSGTTGPSKGVC